MRILFDVVNTRQRHLPITVDRCLVSIKKIDVDFVLMFWILGDTYKQE